MRRAAKYTEAIIKNNEESILKKAIAWVTSPGVMAVLKIGMRIAIALFAMYIAFAISLWVLGYSTYAVVMTVATWGSIISFVGALIPGVNALVLVGSLFGGIVAAVCSSAMEAIAVQAFYYSIAAGFTALIATRMIEKRMTAV
jgi:ABC-type multidrug transport system fused ATPase/permease subunit